MPLTFAHPAAVVAGYRWNRRGLPFPALVIGSMSPDVEYFLRLQPTGHFAHSLPGIVFFCIPAGLALWCLYTFIISPALPDCLPAYVQRRWPIQPTEQNPKGLRHVGALILAVILGALTHIIWDSFTHGTGLVVSHVPFLQSETLGLPRYKLLQHGSTLIGFLIILGWIHRLPTQPTCTPVQTPWPVYGWLAGVFLLALGLLALLFPPHSPGRLVVEIIDASFLALLVSCCYYRHDKETVKTPEPGV